MSELQHIKMSPEQFEDFKQMTGRAHARFVQDPESGEWMEVQPRPRRMTRDHWMLIGVALIVAGIGIVLTQKAGHVQNIGLGVAGTGLLMGMFFMPSLRR